MKMEAPPAAKTYQVNLDIQMCVEIRLDQIGDDMGLFLLLFLWPLQLPLYDYFWTSYDLSTLHKNCDTWWTRNYLVNI